MIIYQTKNDQKDALVIARLMRDGRFSYPRLLEGVEAELRNGCYLTFQDSRRFKCSSKSNHSLARSLFP